MQREETLPGYLLKPNHIGCILPHPSNSEHHPGSKMQTKNVTQKSRSPSIQKMLAALCHRHNCREEDLLAVKIYPDGRLVVILPDGSKTILTVKP
jgi:hypothetical protein